jgi:pSer/pThr/pTyr-binding forkhead associated (FHA) protein
MAGLRLKVNGVEREPDGKVVDLDGGKAVLGRARGCSLRILTDGVSRQHCLLTMVAGRWMVQDLDSSNGTYLNGRRIKTGELRQGDVLQLGKAGPHFEIVALDPPPGEDGDDLTRIVRPHA